MCVLALSIVGCKAKPAETTGFLGHDQRLKQDADIKAFHKLGYKRGVDWYKYKKICIAPVNTHYLHKMDWWGKSSLAAGKRDEDIKALAEYMRKAFTDAQRKNKHKNRLIVASTPDDTTLILELALTEVVPTKAWVNTVSFASIFMSLDTGTVAFEGRVKDGKTKAVLAKFQDRETGKASLIGNIKDFGWYGHAHAIINEWADQFVEITNSEIGEKVGDSLGFELKVW